MPSLTHALVTSGIQSRTVSRSYKTATSVGWSYSNTYPYADRCSPVHTFVTEICKLPQLHYRKYMVCVDDLHRANADRNANHSYDNKTVHIVWKYSMVLVILYPRRHHRHCHVCFSTTLHFLALQVNSAEFGCRRGYTL